MTTLNISLNGEPHSLSAGATVADLVQAVTGRTINEQGQAVDGRRLGIAVARNAAVVPRSQWRGTTLCSEDDVELVTAVQGG
ncbi:sulfur carrier protein ThiS [Pseudarthrobacter sp. J1738]|uniref:sulfur carrier protein ThiS n=1 Tax=unclassified Pseudarthrobacter TaxID=2647000 RepID=UPI003D28CF57